VIETALSEMDEVVVLVYDSPETTDIPLAVRARWIRSLYPAARVIEAWDGPREVGYTPELMRAHEAYLTRCVGTGSVTHFYSSEPYGEHVSRALGAIDRRVDQWRARFPVSGTAVRKDPYAHRGFLHSVVYRDLIANVVLLGAPGTGKSTLARRLAQELRTQWMPEYGREYWEKYQAERRLTPEQLVEIAEEHLIHEEALLVRSNRYLFTDTNAITTATFARYYHGDVPARLAALADQAARRYDLVLVCDTDIPYSDTWDRSGEVNRMAFQRQVIDDLRERKVPFFMLRGDLDERVRRVGQLLGRFRKHMNVLDMIDGWSG
jgi:NadR type nicotinamide-nucleotide adenylyltransferase